LELVLSNRTPQRAGVGGSRCRNYWRMAP